MRGRLLTVLGLAACLAGCDYLRFAPPPTTEEIVLQTRIRDYYNEVQQAFAAGNADALASLFVPEIAKPMTKQQILEWGRKFFGENKNAHFRINKLTFEGIGHIQAVVVLAYHVETPTGKGDFAGEERDLLVQREGRWYISEWEKLR